jgi:hypothetical protein
MKRRGSNKPNDTSPPASPTLERSPSPPLKGEKQKSGHKELKDHYVFHANVRASLLSTEAPAQNYRGLINLVMLVLVLFLLL